MLMIEFFVAGTARTAGSKTAVEQPFGPPKVRHAGKYTKDWMDKIAWFAMQKFGRICLLRGPLILTLWFYRERPKGHYGSGRNAGRLKDSAPLRPTTLPDNVKLARAVEDALTGVIWKDDAQICDHFIHKRYCSAEQKPGVHIRVETLQETKGESHYVTEDQHNGERGREIRAAIQTGPGCQHNSSDQSTDGGLPRGQGHFHSTLT
jgi:Holliday junction resolvase RusA-like endonuclease